MRHDLKTPNDHYFALKMKLSLTVKDVGENFAFYTKFDVIFYKKTNLIVFQSTLK